MTDLDELIRILPPPANARRTYDWAPTEDRLGVPIPNDFKELTATYGDALFCEAIRLFHPSEFEYLDIVEQTFEARELLEMDGLAQRPDSLPEGVTIEPRTMISWGGSQGGDHRLWDAHDSDSERWTLVFATDDQTQWAFYRGTVTRFLLDWMLQRRELNLGYVFDDFREGEKPFVDLFDPADPTVSVVERVVMQ